MLIRSSNKLEKIEMKQTKHVVLWFGILDIRKIENVYHSVDNKSQKLNKTFRTLRHQKYRSRFKKW